LQEIGDRETGADAAALPVLYRDDWLVAVHKPAGLLVHRSDLDRHETRFALQIVRDQLGRRVWPVHRLDKGTSGVLLFALDPDTARRCMAQFEAGQVMKRYLAVVRGWPAEAGEIDHPLAPDAGDRAWQGSPQAAAPQPARTRYRCLATVELPHRVDRYPSSRYALLELEPLTGRRHQLRRHLKHIAHPIIGDATHGKGPHNRLFEALFGCRRLLLAAVELRLQHPVGGAPLVLAVPPAEDFAAVLRHLGWTRYIPPGPRPPIPP
jgi:tRNA pseudouridine65 synthase